MANTRSTTQDGSCIAITNELARIVGLIAIENPDKSIEIRWIEGSDTTRWAIIATDGVDDVLYVADDEQGTWATATADEIAAITRGLPLAYPDFG
jgi:hypothetical protein